MRVSEIVKLNQIELNVVSTVLWNVSHSLILSL